MDTDPVRALEGKKLDGGCMEEKTEPTQTPIDMEKLRRFLEDVRQALRMDGGDLELMGVKDGVVYVKLLGACGHCSISAAHLKQGVEKILVEEVPGIKGIEAVDERVSVQ